MINMRTVTQAAKDQLNDNIDVNNICTVVSGEYINEKADKCPWIGVYRGGVKYAPRTLGGNFWTVSPTLRVIIQASSTKSADDCETKLEDYIGKILVAITADKTLRNTVDMVNEFSIEYGYIETERTSLYFQAAVIIFELEVSIL